MFVLFIPLTTLNHPSVHYATKAAYVVSIHTPLWSTHFVPLVMERRNSLVATLVPRNFHLLPIKADIITNIFGLPTLERTIICHINCSGNYFALLWRCQPLVPNVIHQLNIQFAVAII